MEKRQKLIGDITKGYMLVPEKDAAMAWEFADAIGPYIGINTRKTKYDEMYKGFAIADPFSIKQVIFNDPATIVYWTDGTKTVVKADNEEFDPEKGLSMAIAKKALGNKGNYFNHIKKWTKQYAEKSEKGDD